MLVTIIAAQNHTKNFIAVGSDRIGPRTLPIPADFTLQS